MNQRQNLRQSFDGSADRYHRARPRYPRTLFDRWESLVALEPHAALLEIGPATGVATEELARRGYRITAVELGAALATAARRNLEPFDSVDVITADFETWEPWRWANYDAVVVATAWHWLDPAVSYGLVHRHLKPGGSLAFWSALHVVPTDGDEFFAQLQPVYDEIGAGGSDQWVYPKPGELPTYEDEIEASGLFEVVDISHHDWELTYDADGYLELLSTFSGHIDMTERQRKRLYGEIRQRLSERSDGLLKRHWGAALHVARALG